MINKCKYLLIMSSILGFACKNEMTLVQLNPSVICICETGEIRFSSTSSDIFAEATPKEAIDGEIKIIKNKDDYSARFIVCDNVSLTIKAKGLGGVTELKHEIKKIDHNASIDGRLEPNMIDGKLDGWKFNPMEKNQLRAIHPASAVIKEIKITVNRPGNIIYNDAFLVVPAGETIITDYNNQKWTNGPFYFRAPLNSDELNGKSTIPTFDIKINIACK